MKPNRIMIAAPKSGSGKTTITCALLKALIDNGQSVVSFKCGPDYIDPMFHKKVIGIPSKNLDTFFTDENVTRELFTKNINENNFIVIEGVMGLYDGLGGVREEGSSYHLAQVTDTPIILLIDAKGMGRSVIPMIAGYLAYDRKNLIKGIILNRMSSSYYEIIKPLIEKELDICVLGCFPDKKDIHIDSRHLGLVMPNEIADIKKQLQSVSKELEKSVNLEAIMNIADQACDLPVSHDRSCNTQYENNDGGPVIAVAKDEAFCFYYEDNLSLLQDFGARLQYFSPVHDKKLPDNCDAVLLGGGYPEIYADELSHNVSMKESVRQAYEDGMPIVAECGGFMYLHEELIDADGNHYKMVGTVPGACEYKGKSVRFGYIEITEKQSNFLPQGEYIKGHEFHYYDSTDNGESCIAKKPLTGREYDCIIESDDHWLGFPHLYYPSNSSFAKKFVEKAAEYKKHCVQ